MTLPLLLPPPLLLLLLLLKVVYLQLVWEARLALQQPRHQ
jgi:hypothetical protein